MSAPKPDAVSVCLPIPPPVTETDGRQRPKNDKKDTSTRDTRDAGSFFFVRYPFSHFDPISYIFLSRRSYAVSFGLLCLFSFLTHTHTHLSVRYCVELLTLILHPFYHLFFDSLLSFLVFLFSFFFSLVSDPTSGDTLLEPLPPDRLFRPFLYFFFSSWQLLFF